MAGCMIPHTPIAVDYWKRWDVRSKICFLSHMHTDHTQGLSSSWNQPIFCSEITRSLAIEQLKIQPSLLVAIPVGESTIIPLDNEGVQKMTVTLIDANHCAGAVMFLFQGYFGCILHTGDFRYFDGMLDTHPFTDDIVINTLYLDNTYCDPKCEFPTKSEAKEKILQIIHNNPEQDVRFGLDILGKEDLLCDIAKDQGVPIFVDEFRYKTTKLLGCSEYFTLNVEETFIRAERKNAVNKSTLAHLNKFFPTIGVIPSALYQGRNNPFAKSETIFVVPYSDHSSFSELKTFVGKLKPQRIIPIVGKKSKDEDSHDRADMSIFAAEMSSDAGHHVFDVPETVQTFMSRNFQANVNCRGKKRKASNSYFNGRPKRACGIVFSPEKQKEVCTDKTSSSKSFQENEIDTNETSLGDGTGEKDELPTDSANEADQQTMIPPIKAGKENNKMNETQQPWKKSPPVVDTTLPGAAQSSLDKNPNKNLSINCQGENDELPTDSANEANQQTMVPPIKAGKENNKMNETQQPWKKSPPVVDTTLPGAAQSSLDKNPNKNLSINCQGENDELPNDSANEADQQTVIPPIKAGKENNKMNETQQPWKKSPPVVDTTLPGAAQSSLDKNPNKNLSINCQGENDELPNDSANEADQQTVIPPIKAGKENNKMNEIQQPWKKSPPVVDTTLPGAAQSSLDKNPNKILSINCQGEKVLTTNVTNNKVLDSELVTAVGTTFLGIAQGSSEDTSEKDCVNSRKDKAVAVVQPTLPCSAKTNSDENCLENRSASSESETAMPIKQTGSKVKDDNQDDQTQMFIDELIADIDPTFRGAPQSTAGDNSKQHHSQIRQERETLLAQQIRTQGQSDNLAEKSLENVFAVTGTTLPNVAKSNCSEQETSENRNKSIQDSTAALTEQKRTLVKNDNQDKQMQTSFGKSNAEADTALPPVTQNNTQRTFTDNSTETSNERNTLSSEVANGKVKDCQDDQTHKCIDKSATAKERALLSSAHRNVEETRQSSAGEKLSAEPKLQGGDHDIEMQTSSQTSVVETIGATFLPKPEAHGISRADSQRDKNVEVSPADSTRACIKQQESGYCECLPNAIVPNVYEKQNDTRLDDSQTSQETKENGGAQIFDDERNQEVNQLPKPVETCENDQKKSYEVTEGLLSISLQGPTENEKSLILAPQPRLLSKALSGETEFENSFDPQEKDTEEGDNQINSKTVTHSQGVSPLQDEKEVCLNIFNDTETFVRIEVDECCVQFLDVRSVPCPEKLSKSQIVESIEKENDPSNLEASSTSERGVDETTKSDPLTQQGGEDKAQTTNDKSLNIFELQNQLPPKLFIPLQEPPSCSNDAQIAAAIAPQCPELNHAVMKSERKEEHPDVFNRAVKDVTNSAQKLSKYTLHRCDLRIELDDPAQLTRQIRRNSGTHRMEGDLVNVDTLIPTTQQKSSESEIYLCQSGDKSPKQKKCAELPAYGEGGERPDVHNKNSPFPERSSYSGHFVHPRCVKHAELEIDEKADKILTIDRDMQEPQAKSENMLGEIQVLQCHHPEINPNERKPENARVGENVDCTQNEVSSTTESGTCRFCGCNVETPQVLLNKRDGIQKQSSLLGCDHQLQQLHQMVILGKPVNENADKLPNNPDESSRASEHRDAINCQSALRTNRRTPRAIYTGDVSFARAVLAKWIEKNVKNGEYQSA